jgi:hypothetical protein
MLSRERADIVRYGRRCDFCCAAACLADMS